MFASGTSPTRIYFEIGPEATLEEVLRHWSNGQVSPTAGYWFAGPEGRTNLVDLAKSFGRPFTATVTRNGSSQDPGDGFTTTQRWTLRFTPVEKVEPDVERWQVDVTGTGRELWGEQQFGVSGGTRAVRAGVDVDWTSRTILRLEDGELKSARTQLLVTGVREISEPPGAFDVTPTVVARNPYEPKVTKVGSRRYRLNLFKEESSEWRVDFTVAPTGRAVDVLRAYGLANPERFTEDLRTKPVTVTASDSAPNEPVVVPLAVRTWPRNTDAFDPTASCVAGGAPVPDCFLTSGGERITVTKAK